MSTEERNSSQSLEDQNIFELLGVANGSDNEKELFLDKLQKVIWDDFLDNDVELLLTEDEMKQLTEIVDKEEVEDVQKQEQIVEFLGKIIPDLEDIMLEKALKLKSDMVEERIISLESMYAQDEKKSGLIKDVKKKMEENKWADAVELLNEIDKN
jgi:hypothetical protein